MPKLFLVRHGETEWNRTSRCQGRSDIALNDRGRKQALRLREKLALERIDHVYASNLTRARETARILVGDREIIFCPELQELNFGKVEGLTFSEIQARYPEVASGMQGDALPDLSPYGGESMAALADRVRRFLLSLQQHNGKETVLIVAHGGSLQVLLCSLLGIDLEHWWKLRLSGASLSTVHLFPDGAMLSCLNDVSHLAGLPEDKHRQPERV